MLKQTEGLLQDLAGHSSYKSMYSNLDITVGKVTVPYVDVDNNIEIRNDIGAELKKLGATGNIFKGDLVYIKVDGFDGEVGLSIMPTSDHVHIVVALLAEGDQKEALDNVVRMWRAFGAAGRVGKAFGGIEISLNEWISKWNKSLV